MSQSPPNAPREDADIVTSSDDYATRFAGAVGQWFLQVQADAVLELLAPWPRARVLDVGGGHAQLAGPLIRAGYEVTVAGSDESCRARLDRELPPDSYSFVACDLLDMPLADRSFDVVLSFRYLPHVTRWRDCIAELCRVADRAVVVDYPELRSFNILSQATFGLKKAVEKNTRTFTCFHGADLERAFASGGFGSPVKRPQFFWPMALHRGLGMLWLSRALEGGAAALGLRRLFGSPVVMRLGREAS